MKSSKGVHKKPKKSVKQPVKRVKPNPPESFSSKRKSELTEFLDLYFDDERFENITAEGETLAFVYQETQITLDFSDGEGVTVSYNETFDYFDSNTITEIVEQVVAVFMDADTDAGGVIDDDEMDPDGETHALPEDDKDLKRELENFKIMFGTEYLVTNTMYSMKNLEVIMKLPPLDMLRMTTAQAWGVDPKQDLLIKLDISYEGYYQNSKPPKIEVYQMDEDNLKKKKVKLGVQIQNLLTGFAAFHWQHMSHHSVKDLKPEDAGKYRTLEVAPKNAAATSQDLQQKIQQLVDMGFKKSHCANALTYVTSVEDAVEMLSADDKRIHKPNPKPKEAEKSSKLGKSKKNKASKVDDLFTKSAALKAETDEEKWQCSRDFGFLCMIMAYARRRLPSLNNFCVNCDKPHVFTSGSMLKPAVCSRELCVWAFQQLGVGSEAAGEIATEAEVVDLLVAMAKICVTGPRRELVFDPYPQIFDPDNPEQMVLDPKNKDWNLLSKLINGIPSVQAMTQSDDFVSMKENMERGNKMSFPMLQWIISSNRSHIVQLPSSNMVPSMVTPFQYLLLSDSPEKEEKFRKAKKEFGTVFAFHGSPIANWHGILRKGLINASGGKLQIHGAAYGSGIYLSPAAATSFGYCQMGSYQQSPPVQTGARFLDTSKPLGCIAICEVVDKDIRKSGDIWVHPHEDMVCTRFFFVYPDQKVGNATQFRTDNQAHTKELLTTLDFYK